MPEYRQQRCIIFPPAFPDRPRIQAVFIVGSIQILPGLIKSDGSPTIAIGPIGEEPGVAAILDGHPQIVQMLLEEIG